MGNDTSSMTGDKRAKSSNFSDPVDTRVDDSHTPYSTISTILTILPISAIIVVIVLGNALVIFAVLRDDRLKNKVQNWLILSLSVADLVVGVVIMPLTLSNEILGRWPLGTAMCEIWLALDVLFVTASILNLCVISIDRYWSLTNPVYSASKRTRLRTLTMIACIWILAFAICLPPLVGWRPKNRTPGQCNLSSDVGYVLYSSLGSFYLPLVILIFIYVKIFQITRRRAKVQRRKVRQRENLLLLAGPSPGDEPNAATPLCVNNEPPRRKKATSLLKKSSVRLATGTLSSSGTNCTVTVTHSPSTAQTSAKISFASKGTVPRTVTDDSFPESIPRLSPIKHRSSSGTDSVIPGLLLKPLELQIRMMQHRKLVRRKERQATILLGLILGAFTICWLPFFFIYVLGAICCKTPELAFSIIFWMGYCNSGLNPFIYNFFNPDFRSAFRKILCGRNRARL